MAPGSPVAVETAEQPLNYEASQQQDRPAVGCQSLFFSLCISSLSLQSQVLEEEVLDGNHVVILSDLIDDT